MVMIHRRWLNNDLNLERPVWIRDGNYIYLCERNATLRVKTLLGSGVFFSALKARVLKPNRNVTTLKVGGMNMGTTLLEGDNDTKGNIYRKKQQIFQIGWYVFSANFFGKTFPKKHCVPVHLIAENLRRTLEHVQRISKAKRWLCADKSHNNMHGYISRSLKM